MPKAVDLAKTSRAELLVLHILSVVPPFLGEGSLAPQVWNDVHGALVVVNAGRPIGMLTDRDIAMEVVARGMDPVLVRVGDVMRKKPVTIREDLGILDAARAFAKSGVRRLPVVDSGGQLVGVIAIDDIMILLGNEMGYVAGALSAGLRRAS